MVEGSTTEVEKVTKRYAIDGFTVDVEVRRYPGNSASKITEVYAKVEQDIRWSLVWRQYETDEMDSL